MADPNRDLRPSDGTGAGDDNRSPARRPVSCYVLIGLVVLIALFAILNLAGGGLRGH